ncbi:MAG: hypothetical protein KDJ99_24885, partial [Candidatus Competibacteraceae bacterium]|nr:hypothetical protein [Candidatus Competibacteraceae bacterium]
MRTNKPTQSQVPLFDDNKQRQLPLDYADKIDDLHALDELFERSHAYRTSKDYLEMLKFISRLRQYAPYNAFLLKTQNPQLTYAATAKHWFREFKRQVKPEARPLVILKPFGPVDFVYDMEDTVGKTPLPPDIADTFRVHGPSVDKLYDITVANCADLRIKIVLKKYSRLHAGAVARHAATNHSSQSQYSNSDLGEHLVSAINQAKVIIQAGAYKYPAYAEAMLEKFGEPVRAHLRSIYFFLYYGPDLDRSQMTDPEAVCKIDERKIGRGDHFTIRLNQDHSVSVRYSTLLHELAHIFCGHVGVRDKDDPWKDRSDIKTTIKEIE